MANLNGKVIEIDGVKYTLVEKKDEKKDKAIISMGSVFGTLQTVCDRSELSVKEEGEYEFDGVRFSIEFVAESELEGKLGKRLDKLTDADLLGMISSMLD